MEALHQGYQDIMAMPVGRRKRLCEEHENVLRWRKIKQDAEAKREARRGRRR
jgi:hypothetical protein